jgi:dTDP-4-amino-4,6-dideoxygalactose transaminase
MPEQPIFLTRPYLPPLEDFLPYLAEIWEVGGSPTADPFTSSSRKHSGQYLGVPHVCLFANGTLALMTALQALRITGEVITTPYTFRRNHARAALERNQAGLRRYPARHLQP